MLQFGCEKLNQPFRKNYRWCIVKLIKPAGDHNIRGRKHVYLFFFSLNLRVWACSLLRTPTHGQGSNRLINRLLLFCSLWSLSACAHVCVMKDVTKAHDRLIWVPITHTAVHTHLNLFTPPNTHTYRRAWPRTESQQHHVAEEDTFYFRMIPHPQVHFSLSLFDKDPCFLSHIHSDFLSFLG